MKKNKPDSEQANHISVTYEILTYHNENYYFVYLICVNKIKSVSDSTKKLIEITES